MAPIFGKQFGKQYYESASMNRKSREMSNVSKTGVYRAIGKNRQAQ
jgi:hypothetical protein